MNSNFIKAALVSYFRFKRQVHIIATECGWFSSDLLMIANKHLTEIEIKVSLSDFRADFKKPKHEFFLNNKAHKRMMTTVWAKDGSGKMVLDENNRYIKIGEKVQDCYKHSRPNFFLFAVPDSLVEQVKPILMEKYPHYGLIAISEPVKTRFGKTPPHECVRMVIRPKKLYKEEAHPIIKDTIIARMASEIARLRINALGREYEANEDQKDITESTKDDQGSEAGSEGIA